MKLRSTFVGSMVIALLAVGEASEALAQPVALPEKAAPPAVANVPLLTFGKNSVTVRMLPGGAVFEGNVIIGFDEVSISGDGVVASGNRIKSAKAAWAERTTVLQQLASLYVRTHDNIPPRMRAGLEGPPIEFLNSELEKMGADFRVLAVEGLSVDLCDVVPADVGVPKFRGRCADGRQAPGTRTD
jgi:hypothetical protein